jgi:hypothetical protein
MDGGIRVISLKTLMRLSAGNALRSFSSSGTREKAIADNPDMLIGKALEHRQTSLAAVQSRLQ